MGKTSRPAPDGVGLGKRNVLWESVKDNVKQLYRVKLEARTLVS